MKKMILKIENELEILEKVQDSMIDRYEQITHTFDENDWSIEIEQEFDLLNRMMDYVTHRYNELEKVYKHMRYTYNYMRIPKAKEFNFYRW